MTSLNCVDCVMNDSRTYDNAYYVYDGKSLCYTHLLTRNEKDRTWSDDSKLLDEGRKRYVEPMRVEIYKILRKSLPSNDPNVLSFLAKKIEKFVEDKK